MLMLLVAFATVALSIAGLCAVLKGDTLVMAALLLVLLLVVLIVVPQAPTMMHQLQDKLNTALPMALR
jgi:hypothetical protein